MDPILDFLAYYVGFLLEMGGIVLLISVAAIYALVIFLILRTMLRPYQPTEKSYDQSYDSKF